MKSIRLWRWLAEHEQYSMHPQRMEVEMEEKGTGSATLNVPSVCTVLYCAQGSEYSFHSHNMLSKRTREKCLDVCCLTLNEMKIFPFSGSCVFGSGDVLLSAVLPFATTWFFDCANVAWGMAGSWSLISTNRSLCTTSSAWHVGSRVQTFPQSFPWPAVDTALKSARCGNHEIVVEILLILILIRYLEYDGVRQDGLGR